jgi:subtilisin family serine protease
MLNGANDMNTFAESGSSFASPVVAGVAGLIVAGNLNLFSSPDGVLLKSLLMNKHFASNAALGSSVPGQREVTMKFLP